MDSGRVSPGPTLRKHAYLRGTVILQLYPLIKSKLIIAARGNIVPPAGSKKKGLVLFLLKGNKFKDKKKKEFIYFHQIFNFLNEK